jgi:hypothetical protein
VCGVDDVATDGWSWQWARTGHGDVAEAAVDGGLLVDEIKVEPVPPGGHGLHLLPPRIVLQDLRTMNTACGQPITDFFSWFL